MNQIYYPPDHISTMNPKKIRVIKAKARENLLGNYGPLIAGSLLIDLITMIVSSAFSSMLNYPGIFPYLIFFTANFIIAWLANFFYAGIYHMQLKATRGEKGTFADLIYAAKNGTNRFLIVAAALTLLSLMQEIPRVIMTNQINLNGLLEGAPIEKWVNLEMLLLWSLITLAATILTLVLTLMFCLSFFFLIDNPDMTAGEALLASKKHMKGNKLRLFFLFLSFIGMYLLSLLTLGIIQLWLVPYMNQCLCVFYKTLTTAACENATCS